MTAWNHPQFSLFPDVENSHEPPAVVREKQSVATDVTRVVRSGLVMRPLYELTSRRLPGREEGQPRVWEELDVIWLAFATLDIISEMTEYAPGVSREEVMSRLLPLAKNQVRDHGITRHALEEALHKIFDHLVNREDRYRPFDYPYFDAATGKMQSQKFWLVKTIYTGDGQTALFHLTDEGYTAYFGLYETGALDAAAIGNLRIRLLMDRGRVDDAIAVAQQNQKQLLRKSQEIHAMGRGIRRNINRVDVKAVNAMADEGVIQTGQVQEESSRLNHLVREKLLSDTLGPELQEKLSILGEALEKLNSRLLDLSGELQELPETYHAHSHKLLRRPSPGILPSCEQALTRLASLSPENGAAIGHEFMARFDPPVGRPLFDPASVMEACDRALERQTQALEKGTTVQELDNTPLARFESCLTREIMDHGFDFLTVQLRDQGPAPLSRLLDLACDAGELPLLPVAVAMAVFHCLVDPYYGEKYQFQVVVKQPETLFTLELTDQRTYRGHELILGPAPVPAIKDAPHGS